MPSREGAGQLPALLLDRGQLPSIFSKRGEAHAGLPQVLENEALPSAHPTPSPGYRVRLLCSTVLGVWAARTQAREQLESAASLRGVLQVARVA